MRCFVFGASGLVGSACCEAALRRGFRVTALHGANPLAMEGLEAGQSVDVTSREEVERLLLDAWPDAVINAAAVSNPAGVDADPAGSEKVNVAFPAQLALLTRHLGIPLVHFSSDLVFDGAEESYRSTSTPMPRTLYGQQKLLAEREILAANAGGAVVLRITLVNGNSVTGQRSVHEKILGAVAAGERPRLFSDEMRQPVSASSAAEVAVELLERGNLHGLYHWAGRDVLSRHELGCRVLERFGLSPDLVEEARAGDDPAQADRPRQLRFELEPLASKLRSRPEAIGEQVAALRAPAHLYRWLRENGRV